MNKIVWKVTAVAAAAVFAMSSPGIAQSSQSIPVYTTIYYSDASHTTQVGTITGDCGYRWGGPYVQYSLSGVQSAYSEEYVAYYCGPGGPEPL